MSSLARSVITRAGSRRAFTLIELLTVIAIIGILAAIIIPTVGRVRDAARASKSLTNLKSIGQAVLLHANENKNRLPTLHNGWTQPFWTTQIEPYLVRASKQTEYSVNGAQATISTLFLDPLVPDGKHGTVSDYGANKEVFIPGNPALNQGLPISKIVNPSRTILAVTALYVSNGGASWYIESVDFVNRGWDANVRPDDRGKGNVLAVFADAHAASYPKAEFLEKRRELLLLTP